MVEVPYTICVCVVWRLAILGPLLYRGTCQGLVYKVIKVGSTQVCISSEIPIKRGQKEYGVTYMVEAAYTICV